MTVLAESGESWYHQVLHIAAKVPFLEFLGDQRALKKEGRAGKREGGEDGGASDTEYLRLSNNVRLDA